MPWKEGRFDFECISNVKLKGAFYRTGKVIIYGDIGIFGESKLEGEITQLFGGYRIGDFKIVNQVLSGNIGNNVNLENIREVLLFAEYEPEQFPGLIVKGDENITMLIFGSGSVIITGIKGDYRLTPNLIDQAIDWSNEIIEHATILIS